MLKCYLVPFAQSQEQRLLRQRLNNKMRGEGPKGGQQLLAQLLSDVAILSLGTGARKDGLKRIFETLADGAHRPSRSSQSLNNAHYRVLCRQVAGTS